MPVRAGPWQQKSREGSKPLRLLNISYRDHLTNEEVRNTIQNATGVHDDLLTMVKKWKLRWYGHISRSSGMAKTILQGTVKETRRRGRQKKRWEDNIKEWTGMGLEIPWGQRKTGKGGPKTSEVKELRDERCTNFHLTSFNSFSEIYILSIRPYKSKRDQICPCCKIGQG